MNSRLKLARPAVRPALHARALLSGPTGAGKTRTAMILAAVLAGDLADDPTRGITYIDTEWESALTYAEDFTFNHLPWEPPFNPDELAATIIDAGRTFSVIVVDSLSHFWHGEGGTLDIAGGRYTGWKEARPVQDALVQAFLRCDAHFIGCARSKMEYVQELESGRHVVRKIGMGVKQDSELEYELNVAFEMDMQHNLTVSKSRTTAIPVGRTYRGAQAEEMAATYHAWLAGGDPPADPEVVAKIRERMNALPDQIRSEAKGQFKACLGPPDRLLHGQVDAALELVASFEAVVVETPMEEPVASPPVHLVDVEKPPGPVADDLEQMTAAQQKRLFALLKAQDIHDGDRHDYASAILDREVTSFKDLTRADAKRLIDELTALAPTGVKS
jgi:hypothetical protein